MAVPAKIDNNTVGLIALANKKGGFAQDDLEAVERIAKIFAIYINRMRSELALIASEKKYQVLMNNSTDLICELNQKGYYEYVNKQYADILKLKNAYELVGKSGFERIHPDDKKRVAGIFRGGLKSQKEVTATYRFLNGEKQWIWLESRANFYYDDKEKKYKKKDCHISRNPMEAEL